MTKAELSGDRANRPPSPQVIERAIPSMLRAVNRWVAWRWAWDKRRQTWTRLPVNPRTGNAASSTDGRTWSDFDTAIRMYHAGEADGIGFMLGDGFAGVDLDGCLDSTTGV